MLRILALLCVISFSLPMLEKLFQIMFRDVSTDSSLRLEDSYASLKLMTSHQVDDNQWLKSKAGSQYSYYGDGTCEPSGNQKVLKLLLKEWMRIAGDLNVSYSLGDGTLLGAWRDGQLIPYDTDVDVYINIEDMPALERYASRDTFIFTDRDLIPHFTVQKDWHLPCDERRYISCDGEIYHKVVDQCSFVEPVARLIIGREMHLDIFAFTEFLDELKWGNSKSKHQLFFKYHDVYPLVKCKFMELNVYCPRNTYVLLRKLYGKRLEPNIICKDGIWVVNEISVR